MSHRAVARRVVNLLEQTGLKLAVAESCTGGLVSGALTAIPGVSAVHCGGVIVYRNETKAAYLGIPAAVLRQPGPVSPEVAERMARGVLQMTPEAGIGVSVTGHLGPDAPAELDGRVYAAIAGRKPRRVVCHELTCASPSWVGPVARNGSSGRCCSSWRIASAIDREKGE